MNSIELVWQKLPSFSDISESDEALYSSLRNSGVYASISPPPSYSKTGVYFGASKNLYARFMEHSFNTLAGRYTIPNKDNPSMEKKDRLYSPIEYLHEFADKKRLERCLQELQASLYYYALCPEEYMFGVEKALMINFKDKLNSPEFNQSYFSGNESFQGCKACHLEFQILNNGDKQVLNFVDRNLTYRP